MTRARHGNSAAWNSPKRKRTASRKRNAEAAPAGSKGGARAVTPARSDQPSTRIVKRAAASVPVPQQSSRHLEEAVGHQERGREIAHLFVAQAEVALDVGRRDAEAQPVQVGQQGQDARDRQHLVAHPAGPFVRALRDLGDHRSPALWPIRRPSRRHRPSGGRAAGGLTHERGGRPWAISTSVRTEWLQNASKNRSE